ncbi:MAG: ATP-binding protein [Candidatus Aminicenantes bacterium]|nr:ATP-binding protein [Candidatus Aminicenantes bacterium]
MRDLRRKIDSILELIHSIDESMDESIDNFNIESHLQHSYEVIHSYALLRDCLGCETAGHIAALATKPDTPLNELKKGGSNFKWLDSLPEPELRPELLYVLRELRSVAREAGILTEQTSRAGRLAATARASDTLRTLKEYASQECFEPEKTLLGLIIDRWTEIITKAGGEVGRSALPIDKIPNNYIVGPALRGQKGRLFVGRDDIYHEVTRLWSNEQVKQTVVFYGQRRMGKTSILLHMESNLDSQYLPIFLDMQTLATVTSHDAFLYNLADSISYQLNKTGLGLPIPSRDLYTDEPFIAFRKYIEVAEEVIPPGKWAVLMIDEFELVEEKLNQGAFPLDLMLQFRNIMQHHPRFVLVFAGSHHLDEMRQDYWSPLLNIARLIKVGYLSHSASYELITNPWEDFSLEYSKEAVESIIKAACGQPLLTQSICSGILERVNERLARGGPEMAPTATLEDAEAEIKNILDTSEYFRAVYNALPPDAQNLLKAIALNQKDADEGVGFTEIEIDLPGEEKSAALEILKRRDMIVETGDKIRIAVELVRRWLLR